MRNLPNFHDHLIELATEEGINASGKEEIYGCIFGRDSAITILEILEVHSISPLPVLLEIVKRSLLTLATLQGRVFNIDSGEQPGKFIHEFRKNNFSHLVKLDPPWFVYPEGVLKNYDSIDSTPLALIALYKYWEVTKDQGFLVTVLPAVEAGLNWIISFGDFDKDLFIEYDFPLTRKFGGLSVQSWTDSKESLLDEKGNMPRYPIAPIEAQAFAWLALKLWGNYFAFEHKKFSKKLLSQAEQLKKKVNQEFILQDKGLYFASQALDGDKKQIKTITANPMLCLWAAYFSNGKAESIIDSNLIEQFVQRAFLEDLFVPGAGIRTMSSDSKTFNPNQDSYHNGSFWPMLNGLIVEGLENFGFLKHAQQLKEAALTPIEYFNSPIELYIQKDGQFMEYCSSSGQVSCKVQAWSAAALLYLTANTDF